MLILKRALTFLSLLMMSAQPVYANNLSSFSLMNKIDGRASGNEYFSGNQPGTILMKVNLWGAVLKPGIHHVPTKTNLITLLSYAGGPNDKALLDEVVIKREQGGKSKRIRVDVQQLLNEASHHTVTLEPNDIVMIPSDKPTISNDTVVVISVIGSIVGIILTGIIIHNSSSN